MTKFNIIKVSLMLSPLINMIFFRSTLLKHLIVIGMWLYISKDYLQILSLSLGTFLFEEILKKIGRRR